MKWCPKIFEFTSALFMKITTHLFPFILIHKDGYVMAAIQGVM